MVRYRPITETEGNTPTTQLTIVRDSRVTEYPGTSSVVDPKSAQAGHRDLREMETIWEVQRSIGRAGLPCTQVKGVCEFGR